MSEVEDAQNAAALREIQAHWFGITKPPPRLTISQWAERYRYLSREASSKSGKFRAWPFQTEPMDAICDPTVSETVLVWASQTGGKTEILNNAVGYYIHQDPSPILMVQQTLGYADAWSKERLAPMVRDTPVLSDLVSDPRTRDSGNTILHKSFPGGHVTIVGAESAGGLSMRPIRVEFFDEVDRYLFSLGPDGDPITIAEARTESFHNAVIVKTSTPTRKPKYDDKGKLIDGSRILAEFDDTDRRYWFCPCKKCGRFQTLKWSQVVWPPDEPENARLVCEFADCLYAHTDEERIAMVLAGRWQATAPFTGKRGFHLSGIYSLHRHSRTRKNMLHQMAARFLKAQKKGTEALHTWINTFLAEGWEEQEVETIDSVPLFGRREVFGDHLPEACVFLTAGVDVQTDRIEAQIVGWGEQEESWALEYGVFMGNPQITGPGCVWDTLDSFLLRRFAHPSGQSLGVERTCVDTGHATDEAYTFCQRRSLRSVLAVKGIQGVGMPAITLPRKSGIKRVRLWLVSSNTLHKAIYSRLAIEQPGPSFIHFRSDRPPQFGEEYFDQLTAERIVKGHRAGREVELFDAGNRRNEALDTFGYALAALRQRDVDFARIKARLESPKDVAPVAPVIHRRRNPLLSGVLQGW